MMIEIPARNQTARCGESVLPCNKPNCVALPRRGPSRKSPARPCSCRRGRADQRQEHRARLHQHEGLARRIAAKGPVPTSTIMSPSGAPEAPALEIGVAAVQEIIRGEILEQVTNCALESPGTATPRARCPSWDSWPLHPSPSPIRSPPAAESPRTLESGPFQNHAEHDRGLAFEVWKLNVSGSFAVPAPVTASAACSST
jgi:hypothetical protein